MSVPSRRARSGASAPRPSPQMEEAHPALAREQPGHPRLARQSRQLVMGRCAGSVIADGHLPHPQHLGNEHDVRLHRAGEGLDRQVVGAGVHEGAHPGGAKLPHLAEHLGRRTGQAVGAECRHQGRDPGLQGLARRELRGTKGKAPFASAPRDMGERVHQPRHQVAATAVDAGQRPVSWHRQPLAHPGDATIGHQQILLAERGRTEYLGPLDQCQHGVSPCCMKKEGASSLCLLPINRHRYRT